MTESIARDTLERLCVCPITMQRMQDPVIDPMGFTYEGVAFNEALARRPGICPLTNEPYVPLVREEDDGIFRVLSAVKIAVPNRLVRDFIKELEDIGTIDRHVRQEECFVLPAAAKASPEPTRITTWHAWLPLRELHQESVRDRREASESILGDRHDGFVRCLVVVGCASPFLMFVTAIAMYLLMK
ncbi:hypothetical protein CYMTET_9771 [Cymbomonas tetramitiformis]|uniref:U-box domain-containing protein n=1 Tax=Cymbomonas tetramitiformis TaxID=36881 RepID=A0AAE0LEI7_9CHLO|nr:hypothetical protein CYMTET_9771 [Cymbomonas tetramitiformis]